jgi:hypothetical protein
MSSAELSEWMAYDELEVIPDPVWSTAAICWSVATFNGFGKKKRSIEDFIPREKPVRIMSGEVGRAHMHVMIAHQKAKEALKSQRSAG